MFLDEALFSSLAHPMGTPGLGTWVHPRIALSGGHAVGQTIWLDPASDRTDDALFAACELAADSGSMVAIEAAGRLDTLPERAGRAVEACRLPPGRVQLLLPVADLAAWNPNPVDMIDALHAAGLSTAIFGFKEPDMLLLPALAPGRLLLDIAMTRDVPGCRVATARLHRLIDQVRRWSWRVTALGIDTEVQRALLSGFGCDEGEGALFGEPRPLFPS